MIQKADGDTLTSTLASQGLAAFAPFCRRIVAAFDGFPELDDHDSPRAQLESFLSRTDCMDETERRIRFKHELVKLRAFTCRAYAVINGDIQFFNPLEQSYAEFAAKTDSTETYLTITPYPSDDVILKVIEFATKS